MKTIMNLLGMTALFMATTLSFTQCQKDIDIQDMQAYTMDSQARKGQGQSGKKEKDIKSAEEICDCLAEKFTLEELSQTEIEAIQFMREEEKLARDVYNFLYEEWGQQIFYNISQAENQHMQTMLCLINRYELDDPVGDDVEGVFANEDLARLYETLTARGSESLVAALTVGATIEDIDINDLDMLINGGEVDNKDLLASFAQLIKGSRNHMRAFNKNLVKNGGEYTPQYISEEAFNQIINSETERGGGMCEGEGECDGHGDASGSCDHECDHDSDGQNQGQGKGQGWKGKGQGQTNGGN